MPPETETGQDAGQQTATPQKPDTPNPDENLDVAALRAELKKTRDEAAARRVSERDALKKLAEFETANKTAEENKLKEQSEFKTLYEKEKAAREKAEGEAETLRISALRSKVASEAGLPAALADRLKGTTEDELKADAAELVKTIPAQQQQTPGQRGTTTNAFPSGSTVKETDDQKRIRIFGGGNKKAFGG